MRVTKRRWMNAVVVAALVAAVGCGSDGGADPEPGDDDTTTTANDPTTTDAGPTTAATTTTNPLGDSFDVSKSPPIVVLEQASAWYFEDLMESPAERVGPLEHGESYVVSPDAQVAAVAHAGDAVRAARVEMVSIETGKALATFEVDADSVSLSEFSPDSTAVLGHAANASVVYRIDGTSTPLTESSTRNPVWVSAESGTVAVDCSQCNATQLIAHDGTLRALATDWDADNKRVAGFFDPASKQPVPLPGEWGTVSPNLGACRGHTILSSSFSSGWEYVMLDIATGALVPIEEPASSTQCPLVSADGTKSAFELGAGGTAVVDVGAASSTSVARQGGPLAWDAEGESLIVSGNGVFRVEADGSGGAAASVTFRSFCPIADTGRLLATVAGASNRGDELVVYDVGKDSASTIGPVGSIGATCEISSDSTWLMTGPLFIDLDELTGGEVQRAADVSTLRGERRFLDPAARTSAATVRG